VEEARGTMGVLIVHVSPVIAEGLRLALSRWPALRVVGTASTVAAAASAAARRAPDVVLLDHGVSPMGGAEAAARIMAVAPRTRVIVFVAAVQPELVRAGRAAGVVGYVRMGASQSVVGDAIERVAAGQEFMDPELSAQLVAARSGAMLTERELEVLGLMADGHSNASVARQLGISEETVKTYVKRVLGKLGVESRAHAVAFGLRHGLIR
jgi:DNA-binding NarL/FixJ family response regulator